MADDTALRAGGAARWRRAGPAPTIALEEWYKMSNTPTSRPAATMKNADDLADAPGTSSKHLADEAGALRRLASGILRRQAADVGWTPAQAATLADAADLLRQLADSHEQAASRKQRQLDTKAQRRASMRACVNRYFGTLTDLSDQVALIAAVYPHLARDGFELDDLAERFNDALDSVAGRLAPLEGNMALDTLAADAWTRFQGLCPDLHARHAGLIARLRDAQRCAPPMTPARRPG